MEKLLKIQSELKAPKSNWNSFGKYYYRNCEDILESVKPLLNKYKCSLILTDKIIEVGGRVYVETCAKLKDLETNSVEVVFSYARESAEKKGMDESQITGAASSYARKYALNGLFLIDDTKDADHAPVDIEGYILKIKSAQNINQLKEYFEEITKNPDIKNNKEYLDKIVEEKEKKKEVLSR